MATIELIGRIPGRALDGTIPYYSSYLVVTYEDGTQYYLRGVTSGDSEQATILGVYGEYVPGGPDYDVEGDDVSRILVQADDASVAAMYETMVARADEINAASYPISGPASHLTRASNALAGQLLIAIGVVATDPVTGAPLEPPQVDPAAAPSLGPGGPTLFLPGFFSPLPFPTDPSRFAQMLEDYHNWLVYNAIEPELEQMLTFSEAWFGTRRDDPILVAETREDLAGWLQQTYGLPAVVGDNFDNNVGGSGGAELLAGLKGNDGLTGLAGDDRLFGGDGNDLHDGGTGADAMVGGTGDDTYVVDNPGDQVWERAGEGTDSVNSSVTFALAPDQDIENLTLTGTQGIGATGNGLANNLVGNAAANALWGNDGNDTLNGGAGVDDMYGGFGDDSYFVDNAGDRVNENIGEGTDSVASAVTFTLAANVENLTLTGISSLGGTGNALANIIAGNSGANTLTGNDGDDGLFGNGGNDTLNGGNGNDALNGSTGSDTMFGGAGDDVYTVDSTGDRITENSAQGADTVNSSITLTLGSNVESLVLTGTSSVSGTGNGLNNVLTCNAAPNSLNGSTGSDKLSGGAGNDRLTGGSGPDIFVFGAGTGTDQVLDFADTNNATGDDLLDLSAAGFTSVADVLDSVSASGRNLVLDLGAGNSLALVDYMRNHKLVDFGADDFLL